MEFVSEPQAYDLTPEFDESSPGMRFIKDFEDDSFWETLVNRMAARDIMRKFDARALAEMKLLERIEVERPFAEKWENEFETHGLNRLEIIGQPGVEPRKD